MTACALISRKQPVLLCLVVFEVADVEGDDADDDDEFCSCSSLSPPHPTTADQRQVDGRLSKQKTRSRNTLVNKSCDMSPELSLHSLSESG